MVCVSGMTGLWAQPLHPIVLEGNRSLHRMEVDSSVGIYLDSVGDISWEDVSDDAYRPVVDVLPDIKSGRLKDYIFCFKTTLENRSQDTLHLFFEVPNAEMIVIKVGDEETKYGGELSKPSRRDERFMSQSFKVEVAPGELLPIRGKMEYASVRFSPAEKHFYVQDEVQARSGFFSRPMQTIEYKFILHSTGFLFSIGFVLIFMLLHYVQTRDKLYLTYSVYLGSVLLYSMIDFEGTSSVDMPIYGRFNRLYVLRHPLGLLINVAYFYFVNEFLDLEHKMPKLHKVFTYLIYFLYFNVVLGILLGPVLHRYSLELSLYYFVRFLWFIPAVVFLIVIWRKQLKYGKIVLMGTAILLLGSLVSLVMTMLIGQYRSFWDLPIIYTQYAILIEIAFFSLGVGRKIRDGEQERMTAKEELIHRLKENAELQDQVNHQLQERVQMQASLAEKRALELEKEKAVSQSVHLEKQLAEMELWALRSQMNPHFIFNSLNSIKSYILRSGPLEASEYLTNFSNLIRSILQNSKNAEISLKEEIDTLLLYVKLEQMRFPEKFQFAFFQKSTVSLESVMVPPLILQPYVENAIWHGLLHLENQGILKIEVRESTRGCLKIIIEDNGIGRKRAEELKAHSPKKYKSMGMGITKSRIELHNKINAKGIRVKVFDINAGKDTGTRVEITVLCPQKTNNDESHSN